MAALTVDRRYVRP